MLESTEQTVRYSSLRLYKTITREAAFHGVRTACEGGLTVTHRPRQYQRLLVPRPNLPGSAH